MHGIHFFLVLPVKCLWAYTGVAETGLDSFQRPDRVVLRLGIYPAVDPLDSTSRMLDPSIVGQRHYDIARSTWPGTH